MLILLNKYVVITNFFQKNNFRAGNWFEMVI